jgi:hypothetical protein
MAAATRVRHGSSGLPTGLSERAFTLEPVRVEPLKALIARLGWRRGVGYGGDSGVVAVLDVTRPGCAGPRDPDARRWADLDQREEAADIGPGQPILIDPEYRLDPVLARFLGRSRFAWLADGTRQAYAKDYRLFFSFLWQRGRYWHEADPDDLLDWEAWRRRG